MKDRMIENLECWEAGKGSAEITTFHPFFHPFIQSSIHPFAHSSARSAGFTLIELLVVLAIITIMISVAVATLSGAGTPKQQLRREAGGLTGLFRDARLAAMERKLKIDVYVEPLSRTVCAVESGYARKLLQNNPAFFSEGTDLAEHEPETNRFFRVTKFPEEIGIEAFTLNDIEPEKEGEEPLFEPAGKKDVAGESSESSRPVFSFTHLGGASGGGISVVRDEIRIDIACDLLTGLPEIVRRRAAE